MALDEGDQQEGRIIYCVVEVNKGGGLIDIPYCGGE